MEVPVRCPKCEKTYEVPIEQVGQPARCNVCGHEFTVPATAEDAPSSTLRLGNEESPAPQAPKQSESAPKGPAIESFQPGNGMGQSEEGRKIGPYVVRRKLGGGTMGEVWLAYDADLQRELAIKTLRPQHARDEALLKRFLREARAAARLHHTNTVTVYQVARDGEAVPYIAMEFVEGDSLDKMVESGRQMPWWEATQAIRDAAAGLSAAHDIGLIHRDIKPANLMRTSKGVTKVVDFGLARPAAAETKITVVGELLGTPAYMAPEQWSGAAPDARTDLYGLTCTFYHILTGQLPFDAADLRAMAYQHMCAPAPDPRQWTPDLPDAVCRILVRGMAKEPGQRHQTAAELLSELDAVLGLPVRSLPFPVVNSLGMRLVLIRAGEFVMGNHHTAEEEIEAFRPYGIELTSDYFKDEIPRHRVRITKPFYLGQHLVTVDQFRQFVEDAGYQTDAEKRDGTGAYGWDPAARKFAFRRRYSWRKVGFPQGDEHPVICVSWNDAVAFCQWLSRKEGKTYRLPTEAEWEYACRAGTTTRYSSGDEPETLAEVANVADATAKAEFSWWKTIRASDGYVFTAPVGQFRPNSFGLFDTHGNAWEWCADWYDEEYYSASPVDDPSGPASGSFRVLRGGSWVDRPSGHRSSNRESGAPGDGSAHASFRVARTA